MKTGKVAKAFGIDRKTVSNWTDMPQLKKFFTAEAHSINRTQRDYLEPDLLVINTIRVLRNKSMDWDEIATFLEHGERERELPPSAMLVETTAPIAQYGRLVELQTALETAEEQIDELHEEIERLQQRVDTVRDQERQTANEREQQLLDEIIKLNRQMARLEVRMEMLQEQNDGEEE
jgi:DNA-binding transcriptional MerR regulator